MEIPESGVLCDIMWSDPVDYNEKFIRFGEDQVWQPNNERGCSFYFGKHETSDFLARNKLLTIIRAHECFYEGFKTYNWN